MIILIAFRECLLTNSKILELRNKLVGFFGLKTSGKITDRQKMLANFKCEKNEQMGLFKVF